MTFVLASSAAKAGLKLLWQSESAVPANHLLSIVLVKGDGRVSSKVLTVVMRLGK